jgi:hypothetical protein
LNLDTNVSAGIVTNQNPIGMHFSFPCLCWG